MAKTYDLNITDIKILDTINLLNKDKLYPTHEGVQRILNGDDGVIFTKYNYLATYGTLISYNAKKIARVILMLLRYKYVAKVYDKNTDELYLKITDFGLSSLLEYKKHHKVNYVKKEIINKNYIVKID